MKLTNKNIDETCKSIYEKTLEHSEDSQLALKTRLMAEEILLGYQSKFGEETDFNCTFRKRFGRSQTILTVSGNRYYPLDEENQDEVLRSMTASFDNTPFWNYQNGVNTITWLNKKKKKVSQVVMLLISIVAAILAALICMLLPDSVREIIQGKIIGELLSAFMNIIKCIAGPLVFISIVWGIYCIGDVSQVRTIGRKMLGSFLLIAFLFPLVMMIAVVPFFIVSSVSFASLILVSHLKHAESPSTINISVLSLFLLVHSTNLETTLLLLILSWRRELHLAKETHCKLFF